MRLCIVGSLSFPYDAFQRWLFTGIDLVRHHYGSPVITQLICGKARGPDTWGEEWGVSQRIPILPFPAQWKRFGKKAGVLRNIQMADNLDVLLAFWDGHSRGTHQMIYETRRRGKTVVIVREDGSTTTYNSKMLEGAEGAERWKRICS